MDNIALYEQLRAVPAEAKKAFNNGRFSGTDINPMWRIKRMTEIFGPAGLGWYVEVIRRELVTAPDGINVCAFVGINLFIKVDKVWSAPIYGEGGNTFSTVNSRGVKTVSDEAYKMAYTDAFSNATKQLGLGADIWFENDKVHSTKYDQQREVAEAKAPRGAAAQAQSTPTATSNAAPAQQAVPDKNPQRAATTMTPQQKVLAYFTDNPEAFQWFHANGYEHVGSSDQFTNIELTQIYGTIKDGPKFKAWLENKYKTA